MENGRSRSLPRAVLDQKNSDNTKKATKVALNVFRDYLKERKIDEDSLVASKDTLATVQLFCIASVERIVGKSTRTGLMR